MTGIKGILTSRKFWATVLTLAVLIIGSVSSGFHLDEETGAAFLVIMVSYVIGVSVDPGPGGWQGVLKSRKFWTATVGFVLVLLDGFGIKLPFGLSGDQMIEICLALGGWIVGVALESKQAKLLKVSMIEERLSDVVDRIK